MIKFIPMYYEYRRIFKDLTDEQFGKVVRAALVYAEFNEIVHLEPDEEHAFNIIRDDCDKFWAKHRSR